MITHNLREGYNYNFVFDAAHLYWAARWLELHKSTNERDRMLDELMIRRLRDSAADVMNQAMKMMESTKEISPSEDLEFVTKMIGDKK